MKITSFNHCVLELQEFKSFFNLSSIFKGNLQNVNEFKSKCLKCLKNPCSIYLCLCINGSPSQRDLPPTKVNELKHSSE